MSAVSTASAPLSPEDLLAAVVRSLDAKKAEDLRVLYVGRQSSITDHLVLATGTSDPHLRALRVELEKVLDAGGATIAGMETSPGSGWLVVDAFQIMVHIFSAEQRVNYRLEQLWKDAEPVAVEELLQPAKKPAAKKKTVRKAPAKKAVTKKAAAKKAPAKKAAAKKAPTKKVGARPTTKQAAVKKTPAKKKAAARKSS